MKYYKDSKNQIYAYESDGSQDAFIKPDLTPISEDEALEISNPQTTTEQLSAQARADRDAKLSATTWLVERHREEQETGETTLTAQQYAELLAYRQALRDVPQQAGFPESIQWPATPEF